MGSRLRGNDGWERGDGKARAGGADKQTITSGIFSTAQSLGIRVIAEGVEDTEDFEILADIGVRYFQGYLFAKPAIEKLPTPAFPN